MSIVVEALNRLHEAEQRDLAEASLVMPVNGGRRVLARQILVGGCGLVAVSVSAFWLLPPETLTMARRVVARLTLPTVVTTAPPAFKAPPIARSSAPAPPATPTVAAPSAPPAVTAVTPPPAGAPSVEAAISPEPARLRSLVAATRPDPPSGGIVPAQSRAVLAALEREVAERAALGKAAPPRAPVSSPGSVAPAAPPAVDSVVASAPTREVSRSAFRLGVLYQQAGDHARAVDQYRQQLAVDPRDVSTLNNLAVSLRHLGALEEAVTLLERAVSLDPRYDKALTNLGVVQQLSNRQDAAMAAHLRALAVNPRSWESAFNLGLLLWETDDIERASQFFRKAIALRPHAPASYHLALIAQRQGNTDEAIRRLQEVSRASGGTSPELRADADARLRALLDRARR